MRGLGGIQIIEASSTKRRASRHRTTLGLRGMVRREAAARSTMLVPHRSSSGEFVIKNADYPNWHTLAKAMADHIHYRNGSHRDQRLIKAEQRLLIAA